MKATIKICIKEMKTTIKVCIKHTERCETHKEKL